MSGRVFAVLASATAVFSLGAGCGWSDEEGLTKAEYVKQASAICKKVVNDLGTELQDFTGGEERPRRLQAELIVEAVESVLMPTYEAELRLLRELSSPSGDEAKLEAMFAEVEKGIEQARRNPAVYFKVENEPLAKGKREIERYGITGC